MTTGEIIRNLRLQADVSQDVFGEEIGISRVMVSNIENNRKAASMKTLEKIADYFGVTVDYLLVRSSDPRLTTEQNLKVANVKEKIAKIIADLPEDEQELAWQQLEMYVHFKKSQHKK